MLSLATRLQVPDWKQQVHFAEQASLYKNDCIIVTIVIESKLIALGCYGSVESKDSVSATKYE